MSAWCLHHHRALNPKSQRESTLNSNCCSNTNNFLQKTRIDVYETLCPQQKQVHKGGKIKNWGGECRDVTPTKLQSQNIFKESTGGGGGVGLGGGVRVDVNEELKFL